METFSVVEPIVGGILIGLAASIMMLFNGKILGVSGILGGLLTPQSGDVSWRAMFLGGLMLGGGVLFWFSPEYYSFEINRSLTAMIVAGALVGLGVKLGGGCTSGHGVCGIGRLSQRSVASVMTFTIFGIATTWVINFLMGGAI